MLQKQWCQLFLVLKLLNLRLIDLFTTKQPKQKELLEKQPMNLTGCLDLITEETLKILFKATLTPMKIDIIL